jgi:UDP:flavonoid glycosyltransferase YjiC (YdhE family)
MKQVLILIYAGTETHAGIARVTNALTMAKELDEHGHHVDIAFDGAAVQWIDGLESGHQLSETYEKIKHNVVSVCDF